MRAVTGSSSTPGDRTASAGAKPMKLPEPQPGSSTRPPAKPRSRDRGPDGLDYLGRGVVGVDGGPSGRRPLLVVRAACAVRPGSRQNEGWPRRRSRAPRPSWPSGPGWPARLRWPIGIRLAAGARCAAPPGWPGSWLALRRGRGRACPPGRKRLAPRGLAGLIRRQSPSSRSIGSSLFSDGLG